MNFVNLSYLWSPCGEQICLVHCIHFNRLVISGESKLDARYFKRLKLKWECHNDVNYSRWSCGFDYVSVRQALKWLIVRSW